MDEIWKLGNKTQEKLLRKKVSDFDFSKFTPKEVNNLVVRMRKDMHEANGIGLSANQIGLDMRVFVAEVPDAAGGMKFYAVFNPKLEKAGSEKAVYGDMGRRRTHRADCRERFRQTWQAGEVQGVGTPRARVPARDGSFERKSIH
jgi:hypothetical protein